METWTIFGESGLVQLLINAYKRESKHHRKRLTFKHSKPMQEHFSISLILLQFQQHFYSDSYLVLYVLSKYFVISKLSCFNI